MQVDVASQPALGARIRKQTLIIKEYQMIGWMAKSLAGHDKDRIYIIIEETKEYVWLCDGELRKLENPKRKKGKHVQLIKKDLDECLVEALQNRNEDDKQKKLNPVQINEAIKRTIKLYKQSLE